MSFEIKLPLFEGPFDLMLFFIERDELDIYDIPISKITNDFLEYIHQLEKMEIEVASDFILFAATLMKIKSRMLLPRPELNEKGEEVDPREELIRNLLEYKKYKSVIEEMAQMESLRLSKEKRGNLAQELLELSKNEDVEAEMQHVDLYKLLKVFQKCMARLASRVDETKHTVIQYPYTIEQQKDFVLEKISFKKQVPFEEFIQFNPEKIFVIYTFLAILELLQLSLVTIIIGDGYNNFWVEKTEPIAAA
ncbi:ScpA family protein [Algoriphagus sp.]|uniref:segregation and condensation protein A n=1 Tax=Algoriphagus sp. TaxID=1872435 RepID=UPI0027161EDD|nr:segregation/condensation protein A [Algoriphagus sp.]MDO8966484.1 segregation/condensation protein A [Algoriphagus sp.]MDP3201930.1 segregation/condensation protein A [Algoriphagus sp.]